MRYKKIINFQTEKLAYLAYTWSDREPVCFGHATTTVSLIISLKPSHVNRTEYVMHTGISNSQRFSLQGLWRECGRYFKWPCIYNLKIALSELG